MTYWFHTVSELEGILKEEGLSAGEYAVKREAFIAGLSEEAVYAGLDRRIAVTREALVKGLKTPRRSRSGMTGGAAAAFAGSRRALIGDGLFRRALTYALSINEVNASGGKVVSFPTAGSSGIVPGVIWAWWDSRTAAPSPVPALPEFSPGPYDPRLREAFLLAGLAGVLIAQGATLAGSEGGCQAECGAGGAMAACALAGLEGLSLEACFSAAALSLKNSLGLACDPVAGLVEVPCVKRNAFAAANALTAVDLTLSGITSMIPFDEVVWAMKRIGDAMPSSLKETSLAGLARTPAGLAWKERLESK